MPKPKLPDSERRVVVFGRVKPPTKDFLKSVPEPNEGRAIDRMVESFQCVRDAVIAAERRRDSL